MKNIDKLNEKHNNETIVFFRMDCVSNLILDTMNYLMYNLGDSTIKPRSLNYVKIDYLKKTTPYNKLMNELPIIFENNFLNGNLLDNGNIIPISKMDFFNQAIVTPSSTRVVLIISINPRNEYIGQFQYVFSVLSYLRAKGININIIIKPQNNMSINDPEYFRIRIALKVSYFNDFDFLKNTFWFFDPNTLVCKRIYLNAPTFSDEDSDVGSIFPILKLSKEQYNALCQLCKLGNNEDSDMSDSSEKALLYWCEVESRKFEREVDSEFRDKIIEFTKKDNYLDAILFLYTCYAILKEGNYSRKNKKFEIKVNILNTERLTNLHEICVDFSQGIQQLLENIILHVMGDNNNCGNGTLSIRLHKDIDKQFKMYIYINDIQFFSFKNIVGKFIQNNLHFPKPENLRLNNFFDGCNDELENYLNSTEHIAMHYGLQIFDCVVKEHDGRLYVSSGEKAYDNKKEDAISLNYCGTAYEIEFMIKNLQQSPINYSDMVFPINEENVSNYKNVITALLFSEDSKTFFIQIKEKKIKIHGNNKEELIFSLKNKLIKLCDKTDCIIIDLKNITDVRFYEIIAKSLFLYLNSPDSVNYVAIVNLYNKKDVVKIFRQFALFFNRKGESPFCENKRIFIIDERGDLDVLISGRRLNDIINLSDYERIYGGIDSQMDTIIKKIASRRSLKDGE